MYPTYYGCKYCPIGCKSCFEMKNNSNFTAKLTYNKLNTTL